MLNPFGHLTTFGDIEKGLVEQLNLTKKDKGFYRSGTEINYPTGSLRTVTKHPLPLSSKWLLTSAN